MKYLIIFFTLFVFISSDPFDGSIRNKQSFFKVIARNTFLKAIPIYNKIELLDDENVIGLNKAKMFIYNEENDGDFSQYLKNKNDLYQGFIGKIELDTNSITHYESENIKNLTNENNILTTYYHFYKSYTFKNSNGKSLIIAFYGKIKGTLELERTVYICNSGVFKENECKTSKIKDDPDSTILRNYFHAKLEKLCIEKIKNDFYNSLRNL